MKIKCACGKYEEPTFSRRRIGFPIYEEFGNVRGESKLNYRKVKHDINKCKAVWYRNENQGNKLIWKELYIRYGKA